MIETNGLEPQPTDDQEDCPLCNSLEDDPVFVSNILAAAEEPLEPMTADELIAWLLRQ